MRLKSQISVLSKRIFSVIFIALAFLSVTTSQIFAATTVTTVKSAPTSVPKLSKFEMAFTLSRPFAEGSFLPYYFYDAADTPAANPGRLSPYGVDGITVNAIFTSPSGKTITVPAF
jgi:hypothetical protein